MNTYLNFKWSISRGRDTYGYNICTVKDVQRGTSYRCNGGGYDMQGTSFGEWLQETYQARLVEIKARAKSITDENGYHDQEGGNLYGFIYRAKDGKAWLDGGCGLSSMLNIAHAIGLEVQAVYSRKGGLEGMFIRDTKDED